MFSQGAANVPCTLLHFMDGELIDVAKAKIVEPGNRVFHHNPMPPTVYRVQLVRVLRGCDDLLPPYRPHWADEEDVMTLAPASTGHCFGRRARFVWGRGSPPHRQHR